MSTKIKITSTDVLYETLWTRFAKGEFEIVLRLCAEFVRGCIADERSVAQVFADRQLDQVCQAVGAATFGEIRGDAVPAVSTSTPDCVILATKIYTAGGHTAVIEDLVRTGCFGPKIVLICTNFDNDTPETLQEIAKARFGQSVEFRIAPEGRLLDKLIWIMEQLGVSTPDTLILMNHHYDSVSIAAAQAGLADRTIFYHHADHHLCLGVTLAHPDHVDPHPMGYYNCKNRLHIPAPLYWPLVSGDPGPAPTDQSDQSDPIRTCSSGSEGKFEFAYKYSYFDLVPEILARTEGLHFHIGPLSEINLRRIHKALQQRGIGIERFSHIPWVPSVAAALQQYHVDLYVASFPISGGKVAIEAMAAGIPITAHNSYISPFFGAIDMLYPEAFEWSVPEQLFTHLTGLSRASLRSEGRKARLFFEQTHTLQHLTKVIQAGPLAPEPPPERLHTKDALQSYLDQVRYTDALCEKSSREKIDGLREQIRKNSLVYRSEVESLLKAHAIEVSEIIRSKTGKRNS